MQLSTVITGAPDSILAQLTTLAAANEIQILQKTVSAGSFLVVYDDAGSTGQSIETIKGDPDTLADELNTLIGGGAVINLVSQTFSAATYLVIYI